MLNFPFSKYKFDIKSYHSDQDGKLTLTALFHFLQECAWDNARLNDFGYEYLNKKNAFWVLSRILVQVDEYPNWKDEIEIKTWPKGTDGFFALRDFEVYKEDRIIARIISSWLILDQNSRRPCRLENYNFVHENFLQESAINQTLNKVVLKSDLIQADSRKVYSSDLDVNKHVNNATYVKWVTDSYCAKNSDVISEFEINFISELMLNDEFEVYLGNNEIDQFCVLKNKQGKEVCKVRIK